MGRFDDVELGSERVRQRLRELPDVVVVRTFRVSIRKCLPSDQGRVEALLTEALQGEWEEIRHNLIARLRDRLGDIGAEVEVLP